MIATLAECTSGPTRGRRRPPAWILLAVLLLTGLPNAGRLAAGDGPEQAEAESGAGSPLASEAGNGPPEPVVPEPVLPDDAGRRSTSLRVLLSSLTVFVLAVFVGFEIITKVPPTLHTPLMSGSNAISGITLVGALLVAGGAAVGNSRIWGFVAVVLATINVIGGFLVTHRMLAMFSKPRR